MILCDNTRSQVVFSFQHSALSAIMFVPVLIVTVVTFQYYNNVSMAIVPVLPLPY